MCSSPFESGLILTESLCINTIILITNTTTKSNTEKVIKTYIKKEEEAEVERALLTVENNTDVTMHRSLLL